jgi:predicted PurR-regulated permease PerM
VDLGARRAPLRASVLAPAVGSLDYLLRPYLIKGGADLPLLLILVGVIGGLISLEIIGLFVGLTVLAVT